MLPDDNLLKPDMTVQVQHIALLLLPEKVIQRTERTKKHQRRGIEKGFC